MKMLFLSLLLIVGCIKMDHINAVYSPATIVNSNCSNDCCRLVIKLVNKEIIHTFGSYIANGTYGYLNIRYDEDSNGNKSNCRTYYGSI